MGIVQETEGVTETAAALPLLFSFDMNDLHRELVSSSSSYEFNPPPKFQTFVLMLPFSSDLQWKADGRSSPWITPFSCKNWRAEQHSTAKVKNTGSVMSLHLGIGTTS